MPDDYTYHVLKKTKIKIDILTYLILSCMKIGRCTRIRKTRNLYGTKNCSEIDQKNATAAVSALPPVMRALIGMVGGKATL